MEHAANLDLKKDNFFYPLMPQSCEDESSKYVYFFQLIDKYSLPLINSLRYSTRAQLIWASVEQPM